MHRESCGAFLEPAAAVGPSVVGRLEPGFEGRGGLDCMLNREGERHSRSPRPKARFGAAVSACLELVGNAESQLHPDPEDLLFNRSQLTDVHSRAENTAVGKACAEAWWGL